MRYKVRAETLQEQCFPQRNTRVYLPLSSPEGVHEVGDHKTTSDFKWALTSAGLRDDVQANLYAYDIMVTEKVDLVYGRWIYYLTAAGKRPEARPVEWRFEHPRWKTRSGRSTRRPSAFICYAPNDQTRKT
jgi:hypothetical protein